MLNPIKEVNHIKVDEKTHVSSYYGLYLIMELVIIVWDTWEYINYGLYSL